MGGEGVGAAVIPPVVLFPILKKSSGNPYQLSVAEAYEKKSKNLVLPPLGALFRTPSSKKFKVKIFGTPPRGSQRSK